MPLSNFLRTLSSALVPCLLLVGCSAASSDPSNDFADQPDGGVASPASGAGGASGGAGGSSASTGGSQSGQGGTAPAAGSGGSQADSGGSQIDPASGGASGSGGFVSMLDGSVDPPIVPEDEGLIGWATVSGDGVATTTGGLGGRTVTPATAQELLDFAASSEPLVILVDGQFAVPRLQVASNKTLIGVGPDALISGGVRIRGSSDSHVQNVIVQNLNVDGRTSDVDGDAMQIYYAHHVWVDHCEIFDAPDGNLDVVHAANWVTVSWTIFRYTSSAPDPAHRFSNLIGHSDSNASEDTGRLKVTFHHDYWAEGVIERMPRIRFGDVHVFNSYYAATGNNYGIGAALEARVVVENNFFDGVNDPHIFYGGEPTAEIAASGNVYEGTTGDAQSGQGPAFDPPYAYVPDRAEDVPALVTQGAGPR